jgi:hypothetical protein
VRRPPAAGRLADGLEVTDLYGRGIRAATTFSGTILMNELDTAASTKSEANDEINLRPLIRANESGIRWYVGTIIRERMIQAIGEENLGKVALYFSGSPLDDLTVYVEGPTDLKAKVEEALRKP